MPVTHGKTKLGISKKLISKLKQNFLNNTNTHIHTHTVLYMYVNQYLHFTQWQLILELVSCRTDEFSMKQNIRELGKWKGRGEEKEKERERERKRESERKRERERQRDQHSKTALVHEIG